jgi:hypothetical protein
LACAEKKATESNDDEEGTASTRTTKSSLVVTKVYIKRYVLPQGRLTAVDIPNIDERLTHLRGMYSIPSMLLQLQIKQQPLSSQSKYIRQKLSIQVGGADDVNDNDEETDVNKAGDVHNNNQHRQQCIAAAERWKQNCYENMRKACNWNYEIDDFVQQLLTTASSSFSSSSPSTTFKQLPLASCQTMGSCSNRNKRKDRDSDEHEKGVDVNMNIEEHCHSKKLCV